MNDIIKKLEEANKKYREGNPIMSDSHYDKLVNELPENHPYRNKIEEEDFLENTFKHPIKMLSTQKAKTNEEVLKWVEKVKRIAREHGINPSHVDIRTTAKLDGMAAKLYKTGELVTRGNGDKGNIVTSAFSKGVVNLFNTTGIGEIVMEKDYFESRLKGTFAHPRNVVVGIVMGDEVHEDARIALWKKAVQFVTYDRIYAVECDLETFSDKYREIENEVRENTAYPIDGVVIEVVNGNIKESMGKTDHHNNWQIALKPQDEEAITKLNYITWQTGRTGKVTPVGNVEATELDGSIVRRVTFHNARNVIDKRLSVGAEISIIRSGGVIPKLEKVISSNEMACEVPHYCPSCKSVLEWNDNNVELLCTDISCSAKVNSTILHFFKTIGNCDGFGPSTIDKITSCGYENIPSIYGIEEYNFNSIGFGEKTSANLTEELDKSMRIEIEDWRFLAAFGVKNLGKGNCKKLLQYYQIEDLFNLSEYEISNIEGFAYITSANIIDGLDRINEDFFELFDDFNIKRSVLLSDQEQIFSEISGKSIVFTGKMKANREGMQNHAKELGAIIQSGVSSKTDILVTGDKVGQSKINKAKQHNVKILTEMDYYELVN